MRLFYVILGSAANAAVTKKSKLPPRPDDYDDYWYQDEDETWRNEYDDEGRTSSNFRSIVAKYK